MNTTFLPILAYGALTALAIKAAIVIIVVCIVAWVANRFLGPPNLPDPVKWIVWLVIVIAVIAFVFYAFNIPMP